MQRSAFRRNLTIAACISLAILAGSQAQAIEEGIQELKLPSILVEAEIKPELGDELPPPTYPLQRVEQLPFQGAWHGFVNTTTGGLVFRMVDLKLPGRMPIEFSRTYDSKLSDSMPPPPPGRGEEQRTTHDLGRNWIPAYSSYLNFDSGGFLMQTADGEVIYWDDNGDGTYSLQNGVPSKHLKLEDGPIGTVYETQADGTRWTYELSVGQYDFSLTKIEDRSGNYIELTYTSGYVSRIENSDGAYIDIDRPVYDPPMPPPIYPTQRITEITDSEGRTVTFDYDADGLLIKVTDVMTKDWTFAYDATNDKLLSATDPLSNEYLSATYDASHRIATYEANEGSWSFTYDEPSSETRVEDAFDNEWTYTYDVLGMTTDIEEPTGGTHELDLFERNPVGYTDPEGVSVAWTYDLLHRPLTFTPAGTGSNTISYVYDSTDDWVDSITSLSGGTRTFTRDSDGRVTEEEDPEGGKWTATYDQANGDRLTLTSPNGNEPGASGYQWSFTYDTDGQIDTATDPTGRVFEFDYGPSGELTNFRKPDHEDAQQQVVNAEWVYTRDNAGRITAITDPNGNTWTRTYDTAGRLTAQDGPIDTRVEYTYDARHRITEAKLMDGVNDPATSYVYDAAGRLTSKTLPTGSIWTYGYDGSGRLTSVTDPLTRTWTYTRDPAGRVTTVTHPGGQQVTLTYDDAGRLATRTAPGGRVETFIYQATTDRLTSAELDINTGAWVGRVEHAYDLMDRPTSIKTMVDDGGGALTRELVVSYDANGNRMALSSIPNGENISYFYDELDRLTSTDSDLYDDWTVTYDPHSGHRTKVADGTNCLGWSYDKAGQAVTRDSVWPCDAVEYNYDYDLEGRLKEVFDSAGTDLLQLIQRNPLGQVTLIEEYDSGSTTLSIAYGYDASGQVISQARTLDTGKTEARAFEWDAAGRLSLARVDNEIRTYLWDDLPADTSALLSVKRSPTSPGLPSTEIRYGFDGRVQEILSQPANGGTPTSTEHYRWAPLLADRVLEHGKLDGSTSTYETRWTAVDLGGYYADLDQLFAESDIVNPVLVADSAAWALRETPGLLMPDPSAPFAMGNWKGMLEMERGTHGTALANMVTGLFSSTAPRSFARVAEERQPDAIELLDGFDPAFADVLDDWAEATLLAGGGHGAEPVLLEQAADTAGKGNGPAAFSGNCCTTEEPPFNPLQDCPCGTQLANPFLEGSGGAGGGCIPCGWDTGGGPGPEICFPPFQFDGGYPEPPRYQNMSEGGVTLTNGELVRGSTDITVFDGGGSISFTRTYRSRLRYDGPLGHKWTTNWGEVLLAREGEDPEKVCAEDHTQSCDYYVECGSDGPCIPDPLGCGSLYRWVSPNGVMDFYRNPDGSFDTTPDAEFRLRQDGAEYQLRHVSGITRVFEDDGSSTENPQYRLKSIDEGHRVLSFDYVGGKLETIKANGIPRLELTYENDRLKQVESSIDANHYVAYTYNTCGELYEVTKPDTALETGGPEYQRVLRYTYSNIGQACVAVGEGMHYLEKVEALQFNPMTGATPAFVKVLQTGYYGNYAEPNLRWRVNWQCFGEASCNDEADADLVYDYQISAQPGLRDTLITDRRGAVGWVTTKHEYSYDELRFIRQDAGGTLERVTEYDYDPASKLISKTTFPDGTCKEVEYEEVGGIYLPTTVRQRTATVCQSASTYDPSDIVTHGTYEEFRGRVKTITGPEAFPTGEVPDPFVPDAIGHKPYTVFYKYDFDENYPASVQGDCDEWELQCPLEDENGNPIPPQDINGDPTDDQNWFGNVVAEELWVPGDAYRADATWTTLTTYSAGGRPKVTTNHTGITTTYHYYDDTLSWDWRSGAPLDPDNTGPRGRIVIQEPGATPDALEESFAWSSQRRLLAHQNTEGRITESTFAASGKPLQTKVCRYEQGETACNSNILRENAHTYDLWGREIRSVTSEPNAGPELSETWTTYDPRGDVSSTTVDPDPNVQPGSSSQHPDYLHLLTTFRYDDLGVLQERTSPAGRVDCFTHDALGRTTEIRAVSAFGNDCDDPPDPSDVSAQTEFDVMNRLTRTIDPENNDVYRKYDDHGRLRYLSDASVDLPLQYDWHVETSYDVRGRPTRQIFFGRRNPETEPIASRDVMGIAWLEYDTLGRVIASHRGVSSSYIPEDAVDEQPPASAVPGFELATSRAYYDIDGNLHRTIDPLGREVDYEYDDFNRRNMTLDPVQKVCEDQPTLVCAMDTECPTGSCVATADRDTVQADYDSYGRLERTTTTAYDHTGGSAIRTMDLEYDDWGSIARTIGAEGIEDAIVDYLYDPLGRIEEIARRWKADGTPDFNQDRTVRRIYDEAGRLVESWNRDNGSTWAKTKYGYDDDGLTLWMEDPKLNTSTWDYDDALGLLDRMEYPASGGKIQTVELFDYDKRGLVGTVELSDEEPANPSYVGPKVTWDLNYDAYGRLLSRDVQFADVPVGGPEFFGATRQELAYDDLGRPNRATECSAASCSNESDRIDVVLRYDSMDRLIEEEQWMSVDGTMIERSVLSEYGLDGFRTRTEFPGSAYEIQYTQDAVGRLYQLKARAPDGTGSIGEVASYNYRGGQVWNRTYANGTNAENTFDDLGRLIGLDITSGGVEPTIADFRYGYDRVGNLTHEQRIHEADGGAPLGYRTRVYTMDPRSRLKEWREGFLAATPDFSAETDTDPAGSITSPDDREYWDLDLAGNWTNRETGPSGPSQQFTPNELNQVTSTDENGGQTFEFDWLGQMRKILDTSTGSVTRKHAWDGFGRLTRIRDGLDNVIADYRYDAFNRRVEKYVPGSVNDETTRYIYDGWRAIEERALEVTGTEVETVRARYGFGIGLDEVLWMDRDLPMAPAPPNGIIESRFFAHHDRQGNTIALSTDTGNPATTDVQERFTYSAYGDVEAWWNPDWDDVSASYPGSPYGHSEVELPYLHTGQRLDAESGLHYFKNRFYDPKLGRFLRRDLIGYADGPALYQYAAANPVMFADPLGLLSSGSSVRRARGSECGATCVAMGRAAMAMEMENASQRMPHFNNWGNGGNNRKGSPGGWFHGPSGWGPDRPLGEEGECSEGEGECGDDDEGEGGGDDPGDDEEEPLHLGLWDFVKVVPSTQHIDISQYRTGTSDVLLAGRGRRAPNRPPLSYDQLYRRLRDRIEELTGSPWVIVRPRRTGGVSQREYEQLRDAVAALEAALAVRPSVAPAPPFGIPPWWQTRPTKTTQSRGGIRFIDPANPGNAVRIMPGNPGSPYPNSQRPHVRWTRDGQHLDQSGHPGPRNSSQTHIPMSDFQYLPPGT